MEITSLRFAEAARTLGQAARGSGLVVPAFRSPPRSPSLLRSIRRRGDGTATVSVAVRDRPWHAVLADLIEGVVATNRLDPGPAAVVRDVLWAAVAVEPAVSRDHHLASVADRTVDPVTAGGREAA